jgi:hypothetical protein
VPASCRHGSASALGSTGLVEGFTVCLQYASMKQRCLGPDQIAFNTFFLLVTASSRVSNVTRT